MSVRYVIIEGNEGVGKSSVVANLAGRVDRNKTIVIPVRNPGYSSTGEILRTALFPANDKFVPSVPVQAMLFMAAMRSALDQVESEIKDYQKEYPEKDILVILDRWVYSCWVYQGSDVDIDAMEDFAINEIPEDYHFGGTEWTPTVLLTASYATARQRMEGRAEKLSRYDRMTEEEYTAITDRYQSSGMDYATFIDTDDLTADEVCDAVIQSLTSQGVPTEWFVS